MTTPSPSPGISLISLIVADYDSAISFFVKTLNFTLTEDSPAVSTQTGAAKRWVTIRPPGTSPHSSGILLAQASNPAEKATIGNQFAGRVGLFWRVTGDEFEDTYQRLVRHGVEIVNGPRDEVYGRVCVWKDLCGNKWDLIGLPKTPDRAS